MSAETWAIRDAFRDALSTRTPRCGEELINVVINNLGSLDERRCWRALQWLCHRGIAVFIGRKQVTDHLADSGYLRGTGIEHPGDAIDRRRWELIADDRCVECEAPIDPPRRQPKKWFLCCDCQRGVNAESDRRRQDARAAAGLCTRCGKTAPSPGSLECETCVTRVTRKRKPHGDQSPQAYGPTDAATVGRGETRSRGARPAARRATADRRGDRAREVVVSVEERRVKPRLLTRPPGFCAICAALIPAGESASLPWGRGDAYVRVCADCSDLASDEEAVA